jgi:hypothetical protein
MTRLESIQDIKDTAMKLLKVHVGSDMESPHEEFRQLGCGHAAVRIVRK